MLVTVVKDIFAEGREVAPVTTVTQVVDTLSEGRGVSPATTVTQVVDTGIVSEVIVKLAADGCEPSPLVVSATFVEGEPARTDTTEPPHSTMV